MWLEWKLKNIQSTREHREETEKVLALTHRSPIHFREKLIHWFVESSLTVISSSFCRQISPYLESSVCKGKYCYNKFSVVVLKTGLGLQVCLKSWRSWSWIQLIQVSAWTQTQMSYISELVFIFRVRGSFYDLRLSPGWLYAHSNLHWKDSFHI